MSISSATVLRDGRQPIAVTVAEAKHLSGLGHTKLLGVDWRRHVANGEHWPTSPRYLCIVVSTSIARGPTAAAASRPAAQSASERGEDMNAAAIAAALGDARREGRGWRCRCPLHGGRSLVIGDGDNGLVLATCWAGCDRLDVLTELRRRGLLERTRRLCAAYHFSTAPP